MRLTFEFAHRSATLPQAMSIDGMRAFGRLMRQISMCRPRSLSDCENFPQRLAAVDLKFNKRLTW
jgi:hypothetical protein